MDINIGTLLVIMVILLIIYCFVKCDKELYENFMNIIYSDNNNKKNEI